MFEFYFSRMRSQAFPFIVGVWGVGPVFASCLSCRRGVVWCRRRQVVNSLRLGGAENHFLQSMKSGGRLARNSLFGASNSQGGRSFSRFAWQEQYLEACQCKRVVFCVAGAPLSADAFCNFVAGAGFFDVAKVLVKSRGRDSIL